MRRTVTALLTAGLGLSLAFGATTAASAAPAAPKDTVSARVCEEGGGTVQLIDPATAEVICVGGASDGDDVWG